MNELDRQRRRRIALYSHDTVGLGHLRRNLALASVIVQDSAPTDVLLISGSRESISFPVPDGIDFLTLPALAKRDGEYTPRTLTATLDEVVDLRSRIIAAALTSFQPDVLIVDKVALQQGPHLAADDVQLPHDAVVVDEILDDPRTVDGRGRCDDAIADDPHADTAAGRAVA